MQLRWHSVESAPTGKKLLVLTRAEQSMPLEYAIAIQHSTNVWRSVPLLAVDKEREMSAYYWMELPEIPQTND